MIGSVLVTLTDADLLDLVRQGDETAFTELYARHREVAVRMATTYCRPGEADDLVDVAFEKVLGALRRGRGPTGAFRAYLFVTLRRLAAEQAERPREWPFDEVPEPLAAASALPDLDPTEREMITSAFESLPGRWQAVLWHTAVEGQNPRDLTSLLGMSANAVSALAYRARERLRQAYLQAHLQAAPRPECEPHRSSLGSYVREGQSPRERRATAEHLEHCRSCQALVAELLDVNRLLARAVLPLFAVGSAGRLASALAAATGAAHAGGSASRLGHAANVAQAGSSAGRRSVVGWARVHQIGALASGVAATAALVLGLTRLPHIQGKDATPPAPGTTVDVPGTGSATVVEAMPASRVVPCPAPTPGEAASAGESEAGVSDSAESAEGTDGIDGQETAAAPSATVSDLVASAVGALLGVAAPPTTLPPEAPASLTQVVCTPTEPGRGELTVVVGGADAASSTTTAAPAAGHVGVAVDAPAVDAQVTIDLDDGAHVAVGASLPAGCEVTDDRQGLTCQIESVLPGAVTGTTVGLEVDAAAGEAPSATVTLSDGEHTIVSQTLDLSTVSGLTDTTSSTEP